VPFHPLSLTDCCNI